MTCSARWMSAAYIGAPPYTMVLKPSAVQPAGLGVVHQPLDDGGRGEHREPPDAARQGEDLGGVEAARGRHHVPRARHHMRDGIEAAAMRHRGAVDDGILRLDRVHVHEVAEAHGHQVAMREHHALGLAGGAAGVEQPGEVVRLRAPPALPARPAARRISPRTRHCRRGWSDAARRASGPRDRSPGESSIRTALRPAVARCKTLPWVQLGVDGTTPRRPPDAVQQLEAGGMVRQPQAPDLRTSPSVPSDAPPGGAALAKLRTRHHASPWSSAAVKTRANAP